MQNKPFDEAYKNLFSYPEMIRDLIKGFFNQKWTKDLDFTTLSRYNSNFVSEKLRKREADIIWKIKWKDQNIYLLVLLEFQSSVDKFMAVRVFTYTGLLYLDIIKHDKNLLKTGYLPPILPLVLYNGEAPWSTSKTVSGLYSKNIPKKLLEYQPNMQYWLLDESRCKLNSKVDVKNNLVTPIMQFQQVADSKDVKIAIKYLIRALKASDNDGLIKAYKLYLTRILKLNKIDKKIDFASIKEVNKMLTVVDRIIDKNKEQWLAEGLEQGLEQGELLVIKQLIEKKFGRLSSKQIKKLNLYNSKQLLKLVDKILKAKSPKEIW